MIVEELAYDQQAQSLLAARQQQQMNAGQKAAFDAVMSAVNDSGVRVRLWNATWVQFFFPSAILTSNECAYVICRLGPVLSMVQAVPVRPSSTAACWLLCVVKAKLRWPLHHLALQHCCSRAGAQLIPGSRFQFNFKTTRLARAPHHHVDPLMSRLFA